MSNRRAKGHSQSNSLTALGIRDKLVTDNNDIIDQADKLQNGIASLVLSLVETVIEVLERQAFRRFNADSLSDQEVERLGAAFERMRERMTELASKFDYQPRALELALNANQKDLLGSLAGSSSGATQTVSLADLIDKLIDKETVIAGDVRLAVAGVDLVTLSLLASIKSETFSDSSSHPLTKDDNQIVR